MKLDIFKLIGDVTDSYNKSLNEKLMRRESKASKRHKDFKSFEEECKFFDDRERARDLQEI